MKSRSSEKTTAATDPARAAHGVPLKREILKKTIYPTPVKKLYHYTTQAGLLGIIRSKQIWLTHTQYLNDTREYRHALEIMRSEVQTRIGRAKNAEATDIFSHMLGDLTGHQSINVCVASFSTDPDSLSQWRGYGGPRSAFAICFDGEYLAGLLPEHHFFLVRCIYDLGHQRRIISALVSEVYERIVKSIRNNKPHPRKSGDMSALLHRFAPILKDPAFEEEQEWRIISRPLMNSQKGFAFREGSSALVPYYGFPLSDDKFDFQITEIIVGPTPSAELSIASVGNFLVSQDLRDVPVRASKVPYRNW
jgi:hypothetical protein